MLYRWITVSFHLPLTFVFFQMDVKYLISSKNPCKTELWHWKASEVTVFFFLKERRSGFRVSLQTPRFLSMSLKNYKHTHFWLQQCQGETAAINAINRNPVAHRFQAGLDGNPSFQGRSPQLQMQQSTPRAPVVCPATSSTAHIPWCCVYHNQSHEITQSN